MRNEAERKQGEIKNISHESCSINIYSLLYFKRFKIISKVIPSFDFVIAARTKQIHKLSPFIYLLPTSSPRITDPNAIAISLVLSFLMCQNRHFVLTFDAKPVLNHFLYYWIFFFGLLLRLLSLSDLQVCTITSKVARFEVIM